MTKTDNESYQSIFDRIDEMRAGAKISSVIRPEQCRAARGLLDWSQQELAARAGVGIVTLRQLEAGAHEPRRATLMVIRQALESAGIQFIDENGGGPGVRLRKPLTRPRG
jgi:DNA-binding transcriptional regulator YiaG